MEYVKRVLNKIVREPAVTLGVVVAAVNTAQDQTWAGYGVAAAIALLRFAVSPVFGSTAE